MNHSSGIIAETVSVDLLETLIYKSNKTIYCDYMRKCFYCNYPANLNYVYLDLNCLNQREDNKVLMCERCHNNHNLMIANKATKACIELGLKIEKGEWVYNSKTVGHEVVSIQALEEYVKTLERTVRALQDKTKNLINLGYERPVQLREGEYLIDWGNKKEFHCPTCGRTVNFRKRNGRYEGVCCGKIMTTEIDRIKVKIEGN